MNITKVKDDTYTVTFESTRDKDLFMRMCSQEPMKADEVMAYLGISRQTLCHYVKKGLIKIDSNYTGKQYRYDRESVLALKEKN